MAKTRQQVRTTIQNLSASKLDAKTREILLTMFVGYRRVVVKKEFSGGFGGGRVFLVRPLKKNGQSELLTVIKVGRAALIEDEWERFGEYVRNRLSGAAKIDDEPVYSSDDSWAGIRYSFVGDGIFKIKSLTEFCRKATAEQIIDLLEGQLFRSLRVSWKSQAPYFELLLTQSYDTKLPENLLLEPVKSAGNDPFLLNPQTYASRTYAVGDYVRLMGFCVVRVDEVHKSLTLNLPVPAQSNVWPESYRIRLKPVEDITFYQEKQVVGPFLAVVKETRDTRLEREVRQAFQMPPNLTSKHVISPDGVSLPNPLLELPTLLRQSVDVKIDHIHGDLHLENILVEQRHKSQTISLIDFGLAREDHILHDLFSLENSFLLTVVPKEMQQANLPEHSVIELYERVHCALHHDSISAPPGLEKAFATLVSIRKMAKEHLFDQNEWNEYYYGLTIYLLGALRFKHLKQEVSSPLPKPKQVAFWAAATLVKLFKTEPNCEEMVVKKRPAKTPLAEEESTAVDNQANISQNLAQVKSTPVHQQANISQKLAAAKSNCTSSVHYHDIYSKYEIGVCCLLEYMGRTHIRYSDALIYQQRLEENISRSRRFLDTGARRAERAELIDQLNGLTLAVLGMSFNELSQ